jgi:DNA replication ATP-dependent helicase Dna2
MQTAYTCAPNIGRGRSRARARARTHAPSPAAAGWFAVEVQQPSVFQQVQHPICLGPIRLARRFVLVGDQFQLPPLVRSHAAKGLQRSLFKELADAHPHAVAELDIQYRMSDDIMSLSNLLVYNGKLRAADARVASQRLSLSIAPSQWPGLTTLLAASFLRALLEPDRRVVFLDTDALRPGASLEAHSDGATSNPTEAAIVAECARAFLAGGLDPAELGVIAPYNAQVTIAVE